MKHALRLILRNPRFSLAVIASLALGTGGVTAIFSLLDAVLLRPLPYKDPRQLVVIWENDRIRGTQQERASMPDFVDFRARAKSFSHLAAWSNADLTVTGSGEPRRVSAARVTEDYFAALGIAAPVLKPGTALISQLLWRTHFSADPNIAGRVVTLDGQPHTIVGVVPPEATIPFQNEQLWVPVAGQPNLQFRGMHNFRVYARLKPGVTADQAQTEMTAIMKQLEQEYREDNAGRGAQVVSLHDQVTFGLSRPLYVLLAAMALLLFIACANVAGLLLARTAARRRDTLIRISIGATPSQLLRQALLDNLALVALGAMAGLLVASWALAIIRAAPEGLAPRLATVALDLRAIAATVAASLLAWLIVSLSSWRGLSASRVETRFDAVPVSQGARRTLVIAEVALSVMLLSGAGLLLRSFWQLAHVDPGFDPHNLASLTVQLPPSRYPAPQWPFRVWPEVSNFRVRLLENLKQLPGVTDAAVALYSPASGGWTTRMTVAGRPEPPAGQQDEMHFRPVSHEYFRAARLPIRQGRAFNARDDDRSPQVTIINEAFARRYFPGENPIGKAVNIYGTAREIVGVAGSERFMGLVNPSPPAAFVPLEQFPQPSMTVLVRSQQEASPLFQTIQRKIWEIDPALAAYDVGTVEDQIATSLSQRRLLMGLIGAFAAVALLLAALGIYGVVSFSVGARTREIGVRMALGARAGTMLGMVLRESLWMSAAGSTIGIAASLALTHLLASLLFEVSPRDPVVFAGTAAVAMAAAIAAGLIPARRAAAIAPVEALRHD